MKKILPGLLSLMLALAFVGCGKTETPVSEESSSVSSEAVSSESSESVEAVVSSETEAGSEETQESTETTGVMSFAEYAAAELDTEVTVETYVQAKQSWWDNKATVYGQSEEGAVFMYNMACSEEDYEKLLPGTKIRVNGFKSAWEGEVEIIDATFEILEGNFIAQATDVTALLGTEELIAHQNEFVSFKDMTIVAKKDKDDNDAAFLYNWDGSGSEGNDLYFDAAVGDAVYSFTVESYLYGPGTDVYETVKTLNIGDVVDMEGFLYWYQGANPHITSVTVK